MGPEADHERVIRDVLRQEADRGLHLFDAITFHPYSWGQFPVDSYRRIDDAFVPAAMERRNGRPLWYSEIGDDHTGRIVEWTNNVVTRDVAAINFHDFKQWFEPGTWDNRSYAPDTRHAEMKKLIQRVNRRRRVIRSPGPDEPQVAVREKKPTKRRIQTAVGRLNDWRHELLHGYPST